MHCKNVQVTFQHFPADKLVKPGPAKNTAPSVFHHFINDRELQKLGKLSK